jgi:2-polyprenyl-6-methoxyphenol hydroxylase-like FAD-dependent oxidoreductase
MEIFEKLGCIEPFLENGLKVKKGIAHTGQKELGTITFESCPEPYKHILINPQYETERILREHFEKVAPGCLINGAEVTKLDQRNDLVSLTFEKDGVTHEQEVGYVIGCDGKNSFTRREASIHFSGKRYPDTYIMGDFEDSTEFGDDAVVFLPGAGLIECFPLPEKKRRWVVKTPEYTSDPSPELIAELVKERVGHTLDTSTNTMKSSFGVQHFMAEHFVKDRVLLAGDAAHVVSPIGGQGMNLGWLDAWHLANVMSFCRGISKDFPIADLFVYESKQKPIAKKVARRAEINMRLGRSSSIPWIKHQIVRSMLSKPFSGVTAKLFTMRGLEGWPI